MASAWCAAMFAAGALNWRNFNTSTGWPSAAAKRFQTAHQNLIGKIYIMTRTTKPRAKALAAGASIPQSRAQVIDAIAEIGRRQRERGRIEANMNDEMAALKERFETEAEPHALAIEALRHGVQIWCEAHRDELTQGGKVKTAAFASGEVRWRVTPPKVKITGLEAVMDALRRAGLATFLREKVEISKEAILADPDAVKSIAGIKIEQVEEFVIEPFEAALDEVVS
jgi:phage host-nuclease inhibitor protein Gam